MPVNGRLPRSMLRPIAGGYLRVDAAVRWNAMNAYRRAHGRSTIVPNGQLSSYRTLSGQTLLRRQWCARGRCGNAALPGTSNHGVGLAVDTNDAAGVTRDGARFGWSRRWSDAPWEPWHVKVNLAIAFRAPRTPYWLRVVRRGSRGDHVKRLQVLLRRHGYLRASWKAHTKYTLAVRRAVRKCQRAHHVKADGVVGPATWHMLRQR
jgi:hypothetical protein